MKAFVGTLFVLLTVSRCGVAFGVVGEEFFMRGDANDDGLVTQADATFILDYVNNGAAAPDCDDAADANDDGMIDNSDSVYLLDWLYNGEDPPPDPGPSTCGDDPTSDDLDCDETTHCFESS